MLGFFKYFNFFAASLAGRVRVRSAGISDLVTLHVVLPIGISFYTFMTISYVIDVYRREIAPTTNFVDFALFVAYFPHLVAGPDPARVAAAAADRAAAHDHARADRRGPVADRWGFFQKMFVADNLADLVNAVFDPSATPTGLDVLVAIYAFAFQIYGDFAGYSNIARGAVEADGHRAQRQLPVPVLRRIASGVLAQLAHQPVDVAARLSLHPARRQSRSAMRARRAT